MLVPIENVGEVGINKDVNAWSLPPNVWTDGNNVRAEHGAIQKSPGYVEVMSSCPVAPYYITNLQIGGANYWIVGSTAKIYLHYVCAWTDITISSDLPVINKNPFLKYPISEVSNTPLVNLPL